MITQLVIFVSSEITLEKYLRIKPDITTYIKAFDDPQRGQANNLKEGEEVNSPRSHVT